jgi:hypothetical protein
MDERRKGRDKGLAFARGHLGNGTVAKREPRKDLYVVVFDAECAPRGFANQCESGGDNRIRRRCSASPNGIAQCTGVIR